MIPDVPPKLLLDIRGDTTALAIHHGRVRLHEPAPPTVDPNTGAVLDAGDARAPGHYVAYVVIVPLAGTRHPRLPIQFTTTAVRCYGRTPIEASALRWAVSNAIHNTGPRVYTNDLGIYNSLESGGGDTEFDPETQQPYMSLVIEAPATTQAVA